MIDGHELHLQRVLAQTGRDCGVEPAHRHERCVEVEVDVPLVRVMQRGDRSDLVAIESKVDCDIGRVPVEHLPPNAAKISSRAVVDGRVR